MGFRRKQEVLEITPQILQRMKYMYESGVPEYKIAKKFQMGYSKMKQIAKANEWKSGKTRNVFK